MATHSLVLHTFDIEGRTVYVNFSKDRRFIAWDHKGERYIFQNLVREGFSWWDPVRGVKHMQCYRWLLRFCSEAEKARTKGYKPWDTWRQSVTYNTGTYLGNTCPEIDHCVERPAKFFMPDYVK